MSKENNNLKRYKYSTITMVVVYIIITSIDLIKDALSNQAIMMLSIFLLVDNLVAFLEERKIKRLLLVILMAIIFIFFTYEYICGL